MDSSLIKIFNPHGLIAYSLFFWNSHFDESNTRFKAFFVENAFFLDFNSILNFAVELLQFLNEFLSFSRSETTQKLYLVEHVLVVDYEIDVNPYFIQKLNVDFLKDID